MYITETNVKSAKYDFYFSLLISGNFTDNYLPFLYGLVFPIAVAPPPLPHLLTAPCAPSTKLFPTKATLK